jgi:hypothetical protein
MKPEVRGVTYVIGHRTGLVLSVGSDKFIRETHPGDLT